MGGGNRPFLEGFHLILVQDGDPDRYLKIPEWADYELYNRRDIEAALGDRAWIISQVRGLSLSLTLSCDSHYHTICIHSL
jgi:hypothetical protein